MLDIYPAREKIDLGMHSSQIVERMDHPSAVYVPDIEGAAAYLLERVEPDDVVITMSAGDGNQVGQILLDALRRARRRGMNAHAPANDAMLTQRLAA